MILYRFLKYTFCFSLFASIACASNSKFFQNGMKAIVSCVATSFLLDKTQKLYATHGPFLHTTLAHADTALQEETIPDVYRQIEPRLFDRGDTGFNYELLPLLKDTNPKLDRFFEQIREKKGIEEPIPIFDVSACNLSEFCGRKVYYVAYPIAVGYVAKSQSLQYMLLPALIVNCKSKQQHRMSKEQYCYLSYLAYHEYEHHRQAFKYFGSYHGDNPYYREQAADAAAFADLNCYMCLHSMKVQHLNPYVANRGYFTYYDMDLYYQSAKFQKALCTKHKQLPCWYRAFALPERDNFSIE